MEEHIAKQDYKTLEENLAKKFLKRRCRFIDRLCSYTNPVTSKKETWLGCRNGHAICRVRNSYFRELQSGAQPGRLSLRRFEGGNLKRSSLATGTAFFSRLNNLNRHNTQLGHTEALEAYCHRLRAQAAQGAGDSVVSTFASGA